jgi:polysaccharide deacetylase 2 family uncharacterized protein YibQ
MAIRVRREHLPWLALAVLACFGVLALVGITLAGWQGEVRYAGNPVEQRPLVGSTASAAVAGERQSVPGKKVPTGAAAMPGGLDAVGLASIGSGIQRPPTAEKPKVAILVTGIGLARARSEPALSLPPAVGLAISPYADDAPGWIEAARAGGHETFLMLPLEPTDPARIDPGPHAIGPQLGTPERAARLGWLLERAGGVIGFVAEAGAYGATPQAFAPVAQALAAHGAGMIELGGTHLEPATRSAGLAFAGTSAALDAVAAGESIDTALALIETQALGAGRALGWARGHRVSLERLAAWIPTLAGKGLSLVPVSALLAEGDRVTATR